MLEFLHIENIAVIESTDIELTDGFNALTGETGAGKSIVIDSINAVLGERTSKELIRNGCERAEVSAVFGDLSPAALSVLCENGFEPDEDKKVLIRRTLSLSGNGTIKINGRPATATILREIGKHLVNIHGQHDNQSLLDPDKHYHFIDLVAENDALIDEYYSEFKHLNSVRRELEALEVDEEEKARKTELLRYQVDELTKADIRVGELEELKEKQKIADDYKRIMGELKLAYSALCGSDENDGAMSLIKNAEKNLSSVSGFDGSGEKLGEAFLLLEEVSGDIRAFTENGEYSALDTEELSQRLDLLYKLMLKYGDSEEKMLDFLDRAQKELDGITHSEERTALLAEELQSSTERLVGIGERLTKSRADAAKKFSKDVTDVLCYLDMQNALFEVKIEKGRYTKHGCDNVEFMICANAGEALHPLHKTASGGELSRIMLAIKSVLAGKDDIDTLIFDEVDTGISGRAAGKVGVLLQKVSRDRQVVCVTHLAQIAARASNHLLIEKSEQQGRTYTSVRTLESEERIREVARIMSGTEISEKLYDSAKELLDRSINNEDL